MADRILKSDSGNDTVIQNNSGSRKIEVTDSADVEVTGDFKTTTVKTTNLKANDGTAGLVVADSTGRVQVSEKIETDDILEKTAGHGVEIDSVLLKDGGIDQTAKIVSSIDTFNITKASVTGSLSYIDCVASTDSFYSPVAGNVTVSNVNVLNFGTTGLYEFFYQIQYDINIAANSLRFRIWATTDGSDPTSSSTLIYLDESSKDTNNHHTQKGGFKLNINSTNIKLRPSIDTSTSTTAVNILRASDFSLASLLVSYFQFTKIGANI